MGLSLNMTLWAEGRDEAMRLLSIGVQNHIDAIMSAKCIYPDLTASVVICLHNDLKVFFQGCGSTADYSRGLSPYAADR